MTEPAPDAAPEVVAEATVEGAAEPASGPTSRPESEPRSAPTSQPARLRYRLLTGTDDRAFCEKVSAALHAGYRLHGGPAVTFDGERVVTAQAVVLDEPGESW